MAFCWQNQYPSKVQISLIWSLIKTTDFNGKLNKQDAFLMDVSLYCANNEEACITTSSAWVCQLKKKVNTSLLYPQMMAALLWIFLMLGRKYCSEVSSSILS